MTQQQKRLAALRRNYASPDTFASARLVTLGDGAERGVRVIELRGAAGLEAEVVIDRGFDLGRLALHGQTLSWHSAGGYRAPWLIEQAVTRGQGFLMAMSGLLSTCGYDHIRQPQSDTVPYAPLHPSGEQTYPLHGMAAHQPARLIGYGTELDDPEPYLWCEGEVTQSMMFSGALRLRRRITMPLFSRTIRLKDRLENIGEHPMPVMMLYHVNLGYPVSGPEAVVDRGEGKVIWTSPDKTEGSPSELYVFRPEGQGEWAACSAQNPATGAGLALRYSRDTLPYLQILRLKHGGAPLLALEPCTTGARTREAARQKGEMPMLEPGQVRNFRLEFSPNLPIAAKD